MATALGGGPRDAGRARPCLLAEWFPAGAGSIRSAGRGKQPAPLATPAESPSDTRVACPVTRRCMSPSPSRSCTRGFACLLHGTPEVKRPPSPARAFSCARSLTAPMAWLPWPTEKFAHFKAWAERCRGSGPMAYGLWTLTPMPDASPSCGHVVVARLAFWTRPQEDIGWCREWQPRLLAGAQRLWHGGSLKFTIHAEIPSRSRHIPRSSAAARDFTPRGFPSRGLPVACQKL